MICVTAAYPNHKGSRFDIHYYQTKHAPFAWSLLAPHGLASLRVTAGESAIDGSLPAFWAIAEMRFFSRAAFETAIAKCGAELFADAPNYTDVQPILQIASGVPLPSPIQEH